MRMGGPEWKKTNVCRLQNVDARYVHINAMHIIMHIICTVEVCSSIYLTVIYARSYCLLRPHLFADKYTHKYSAGAAELWTDSWALWRTLHVRTDNGKYLLLLCILVWKEVTACPQRKIYRIFDALGICLGERNEMTPSVWDVRNVLWNGRGRTFAHFYSILFDSVRIRWNYASLDAAIVRKLW